MSCLSCHDPRTLPKPQERAAYFRDRCLQCHQAERLPATHDRTSDCASCHMPRARTVDGGHGVMTDHGIRSPGQSSPRKASQVVAAARRLIPFAGFTSDERMLGLACAEVAVAGGDRSLESEALGLLTVALKQHPRDAEILARLGFIYSQRGDAARAGRAYEIALQVDPHHTVALVNLGGIYAGRGKLEDAIKLWREALERNAGLTEASINLARANRAQGKTPQARDVLRRAMRFDPDSKAARRTLKDLDSASRRDQAKE
jgi:tetratricopeptide (TPR) repeat protein